MATVKRYDVCSGEKYLDNQGQEKISWKNVGKAFLSDKGGISIKMGSVPCPPWDGWLQLFEERPKEQGSQPPPAQGGGIQPNQQFAPPAPTAQPQQGWGAPPMNEDGPF